MVLSASIIFTLGVVHLVYTFWGPKLTPRDPALQISPSPIHPSLDGAFLSVQFTVCTNDAELVVKSVPPLKVAVMVVAPFGSVGVVTLALPPLNVILPSDLVPALNVTVPTGFVPVLPVINAVKVTGWPCTDGFCDEVSVAGVAVWIF